MHLVRHLVVRWGSFNWVWVSSLRHPVFRPIFGCLADCWVVIPPSTCADILPVFFWHSICHCIWILPDILPGFSSGILSDIYTDILSGMLSGTVPKIFSDILSGIVFGMLSGILTFYLAPMKALFRAFHLTFHLVTFYLEILLAFYDMSSGILKTLSLTFYQSIRHYIGHPFGHGVWHSMWHLALAIGVLVPTETWLSQLTSGSGSDHWHLALAVEVRQCTLRSGACSEGVVRGCRRRRRKEEAEASLIKSRNPHLTGGEKHL